MSNEEGEFRRIANRAYSRWSAAPTMELEAFLSQLATNERIVVHLDCLINEIHNGGFAQWQFNGNQTAAAEADLESILSQIGTPAALQTLALLDQFRKLGNVEEPKADEIEFDRVLRALDDAFYEIDDLLIADTEAFFVGRSSDSQHLGVNPADPSLSTPPISR